MRSPKIHNIFLKISTEILSLINILMKFAGCTGIFINYKSANLYLDNINLLNK